VKTRDKNYLGDNPKYLKVKGHTRTGHANKNSIQEEIKSNLKSGNACYHSVENLLSTSLLSKTLKIKIYRTTLLSVFCMGVRLGH
jgi:hypothetical protein